MTMDNPALEIEWANHWGIKEIRYLASGDDSDTFLCDNRYVVKVPKRESVRQIQKREFQLYAFLCKQKLSFQTPRVIYQGDHYNIMTFIPGHRLTYRDYHTLSGKEQDALARDEALFLRELHRIPVDKTEPFFLSAQQNKKAQYQTDYEKVIRILIENKRMNRDLQKKMDNMYAHIFQMDFLFHYRACITHNDFSADNMVFQNNRLFGVIDFGDFVIGDPDNDFLCLLDSSTDDFGKEFGRKVLYHYGHNAPELAEKKAEINDAYWPIQQILLGNERKEAWLTAKGIQELTELDISVFS